MSGGVTASGQSSEGALQQLVWSALTAQAARAAGMPFPGWGLDNEGDSEDCEGDGEDGEGAGSDEVDSDGDDVQ